MTPSTIPEHAGIYYHPEAEKQFYKLPATSQASLAEFLEAQRAALEASGGGNKEGLYAEWEPGRVVYWDIKLRPRPEGTGTASGAKGRLGSWYRIEVLEIGSLPAS